MSQTSVTIICPKCKHHYLVNPPDLFGRCPYCGEPASILMKLIEKLRR